MSEDNIGINTDSGMPRICVRMSREQRKRLERLVESGKFPNLSEAIRHAIRNELSEEPVSDSYEKRRV
jgi:antitoxin ParD1/3/4